MWKYVLPSAGKCLHLETVVPNELLHSLSKNRFVRVPPWSTTTTTTHTPFVKKGQDSTPGHFGLSVRSL